MTGYEWMKNHLCPEHILYELEGMTGVAFDTAINKCVAGCIRGVSCSACWKTFLESELRGDEEE